MLETQKPPQEAGRSAPQPAAKSNGTPEPKLKDAIRVGLCGVGRAGLGMVKRDLLNLPHIQIVASVDLMPERSQQLAEFYPSKICSSYKELLASDDIELVIVATRSHEHVAMGLEALKAGKDVLVEKPMSLDLAGADKLIKAAEKNKRRLFVRQNRRFDAPFLQAMEIVQSGKIGKLFSVQLRQGGYQRRADWQALKRFGGGQLLNWGPHLIDWGLQFMGGKAVDIWADLKLIAAAGDAEDHVKLLMRGPNEVVVDIEISGAAALPQTPWLLMGSCGSLQIDANGQCRLRYFDPAKLTPLSASDVTPIGRAGSHFSGGEDIQWVDLQFAVPPVKGGKFWVALYQTIRNGEPFPISLEQARNDESSFTCKEGIEVLIKAFSYPYRVAVAP